MRLDVIMKDYFEICEEKCKAPEAEALEAVFQRAYGHLVEYVPAPACLINIIEATKLARANDPSGFKLMKNAINDFDLPGGSVRLSDSLFKGSNTERAILEAQEQGFIAEGDAFSIFLGFLANVFFQLDLAATFNKPMPSNDSLLRNIILLDAESRRLQSRTLVNTNAEELNNKLYRDPLTAAYNRYFLDEHYGQKLSNVAMAMLDLDYMKEINDRFGHKAGDMALVSVACTIQKFIRKNDHLIRLGGDEFLLIMNGIPNEIFGKKLDFISNAIKATKFEAYPELQLSLTIGGVYGSGTKQEMLERADKLLYKGKEYRGSIFVSALDGSNLEQYGSCALRRNTNIATQALAEVTRGPRRTVLIIEDNEINREVLVELLSEDYKVLQAGNGLVGLDLLRQNLKEISVVILDVEMPIMNGYEFLAAMKRYPLLSEVPVIVATGNNFQEEEQRCLALGAVDFVTKPYNMEIIKSRIAGIIRLKESSATMSVLQADELTGIYNLRAFSYYAKQTLDNAPTTPYSLTVIDINQLRVINDSYGEEVGNQILRNMANTIKSYADINTVYGRYGSARFMILKETMPEVATEAWINALFAKLKAACDIKSITFKAGIYNDIDKSLSIYAIYDRAILAMHSAQQGFESHYAVYDEKHAEHERRLAAMEAVMKEAYDQGQFSVYYQPKHDAYTGKLVGAEALVRWVHPELGFLSPGDFIPLFERNGFISYVDYYVWNRTCKNLRAWMDEGLAVVPISVNASRKDFDHDIYMEKLMQPVKENAVPTELLHIEVTESLFSDRIEQLSKVMQESKAAGFQIELDDFGTGYSSLTTLASLPLDVMKLDMSFMRNYRDERKLKVLAASINLAKSLGLKTVAEGVENSEQLELLLRHGIDYIQGYYFSAPLPEEKFREYMLKQQV